MPNQYISVLKNVKEVCKNSLPFRTARNIENYNVLKLELKFKTAKKTFIFLNHRKINSVGMAVMF